MTMLRSCDLSCRRISHHLPAARLHGVTSDREGGRHRRFRTSELVDGFVVVLLCTRAIDEEPGVLDMVHARLSSGCDRLTAEAVDADPSPQTMGFVSQSHDLLRSV